MDNYDPLKGKTYTLSGGSAGTETYYATIKDLADKILLKCPDEERLLRHIRWAGKNILSRQISGRNIDRPLISFMRGALRTELESYTTAVREHLRKLPLLSKFDLTLTTREEQYHLYMLEIELVNRFYRKRFRDSAYKFALFPHCLCDFRAACAARPGDIEAVCMGCAEDCFIRLGSVLLKKYGIEPYISVSMDQNILFRKLKIKHPSIGALGIACVPELAMGMRLCVRLDINPVGIPLDANRCSRWMKHAHETSFSIKELEDLLN
jgi:hypothetical protein